MTELMIEFTFESLTFRQKRGQSRNLVAFEEQFYSQPTEANLHIAEAQLPSVPMIEKIRFKIHHINKSFLLNNNETGL